MLSRLWFLVWVLVMLTRNAFATCNATEAPAIIRLDGCSREGCQTEGGTVVAASGHNLGPDRRVYVGGVLCRMGPTQNDTYVEFFTPPGAGTHQAVVVETAEGRSLPFFGLSYARPSVQELIAGNGGCSNVTDCGSSTGNLITVCNCPRLGGGIVTIVGNNFGPASQGTKVLVGQKTCSNVSHFAGVQAHRKLSCILPPGEFFSPLIVIQNHGRVQQNRTSFVDYHPCPKGSKRGSPKDLHGLDLYRCINCTAGSYSDETNSNTCHFCRPGTYSGTVGATTCKPCKEGFFSSQYMASACSTCPSGKYTPASGASACVLCPAGKYILPRSILGNNFPADHSACQACPDVVGVKCTGTQVQFGGFLAVSGLTVTPYACPGGYCCPTGKCNVTHQCGTGRNQSADNVLCGHCETGLEQWGSDCLFCESYRHGLAVALLFGSVIFCFMVVAAAQTGSDHRNSTATKSKILFYFAQVSFIMLGSQFPHELPFISWFNADLFGASPGWTPTCLWQLSELSKVLLDAFLPLFLFAELLTVGVVHFLCSLCYSASRRPGCAVREWTSRWARRWSTLYARGFLALYLVTFTQLFASSLRLLISENVLVQRHYEDQPSSYCVLSAHPQIRCSDSKYHAGWFLAILVLAILVVSPLLLFWVLGKEEVKEQIKRDFLTDMQNQDALAHGREVKDGRRAKSLAYMYECYRTDNKATRSYEVAALLRRVAFVVASLLLSSLERQRLRALAFAFLNLFSLCYAVYVRPFRPTEVPTWWLQCCTKVGWQARLTRWKRTFKKLAGSVSVAGSAPHSRTSSWDDSSWYQMLGGSEEFTEAWVEVERERERERAMEERRRRRRRLRAATRAASHARSVSSGSGAGSRSQRTYTISSIFAPPNVVAAPDEAPPDMDVRSEAARSIVEEADAEEEEDVEDEEEYSDDDGNISEDEQEFQQEEYDRLLEQQQRMWLGTDNTLEVLCHLTLLCVSLVLINHPESPYPLAIEILVVIVVDIPLALGFSVLLYLLVLRLRGLCDLLWVRVRRKRRDSQNFAANPGLRQSLLNVDSLGDNEEISWRFFEAGGGRDRHQSDTGAMSVARRVADRNTTSAVSASPLPLHRTRARTMPHHSRPASVDMDNLKLLGDAIHGDVRVPNTLEMQRGPAPLPTHSRQHSRRVSLPVDAAEADVGAPNASARQLRTRSAM